MVRLPLVAPLVDAVQTPHQLGAARELRLIQSIAGRPEGAVQAICQSFADCVIVTEKVWLPPVFKVTVALADLVAPESDVAVMNNARHGAKNAKISFHFKSGDKSRLRSDKLSGRRGCEGCPVGAFHLRFSNRGVKSATTHSIGFGMRRR
jgi:hypothetical protein